MEGEKLPASEPTLEAAQPGWNILIVDDEPDVHAATRLAVKRKTWRNRPFKLEGVNSAKAARDMLMKDGYGERLQVAVVDVVMETRFAGLDLCRFIRAELPRSVRIILRTGQPGVAPEESIINDYDIDFYVAKSEATAERLYMALRSCLRSSQDIETLLALGDQLRSFTTALQKMTSREDLSRFMRAGLDFLELKHSAKIQFLSDITEAADARAEDTRAIAKAFELGLEPGKLHPAKEIGIDEPWFVFAFTVATAGAQPRRGGFVVHAAGTARHGLENDLALFIENWTVALAGLLVQTRAAKAGELVELSYLDRIGGFAAVLGGATRRIKASVSHAVTTTTNLKRVGDEVSDAVAEQLDQFQQRKRVAELFRDVRDGLGTLDRDLADAKRVIESFERVSAVQLRDERGPLDLVAFVNGCIQLIEIPVGYEVIVSSSQPTLRWVGYPGSLSHVVLKFVQGAIRHAYDDESGKIDVRLLEDETGYRIEIEDSGKGGIPDALIQRLSTEVDEDMPTMVGTRIAVAHRIVTHRLAGRLTCTSVEGEGTKFVIRLPREVPASH